jgi:hypothetical protein
MFYLFATPFNWPAGILIRVWFAKENQHLLVFSHVHMLEAGKHEPVFEGLKRSVLCSGQPRPSGNTAQPCINKQNGGFHPLY